MQEESCDRIFTKEQKLHERTSINEKEEFVSKMNSDLPRLPDSHMEDLINCTKPKSSKDVDKQEAEISVNDEFYSCDGELSYHLKSVEGNIISRNFEDCSSDEENFSTVPVTWTDKFVERHDTIVRDAGTRNLKDCLMGIISHP